MKSLALLGCILALALSACDGGEPIPGGPGMPGIVTLPAGCSNPTAPAGTWTTGETGQAKTLALLADHTFVEETPAGEVRGTWSTDAGAIMFITSEGSQDAPKSYWVVGDNLVIDETTWNPVCP